MFTYDEAVRVAGEYAKRDGHSTVVAEATPEAERGEPLRYVVGPTRGWSPPERLFRVVAEVGEDGSVRRRATASPSST